MELALSPYGSQTKSTTKTILGTNVTVPPLDKFWLWIYLTLDPLIKKLYHLTFSLIIKASARILDYSEVKACGAETGMCRVPGMPRLYRALRAPAKPSTAFSQQDILTLFLLEKEKEENNNNHWRQDGAILLGYSQWIIPADQTLRHRFTLTTAENMENASFHGSMELDPSLLFLPILYLQLWPTHILLLLFMYFV